MIYVDPTGLEFRESGQPGRGGVYGPGVLRSRFLSDLRPAQGKIENRVVCTCGFVPDDADVDFFITPSSGDWIKILDGDVYLTRSTEDAFGYDHINAFGNGNYARGLSPSMTSRRTNGALWWLYGHKNPKKKDRTPGEYLDDLNSGELESEDDSCIGFFN